jgi:hypothetical protein
MLLHLAPRAHAVRVGEDIVFLDVEADRYLCWPNASGIALSADRRRLGCASPDDVADLAASGLVGRGSSPMPSSAPIVADAPTRELTEPARDATTPGERADFLRGCLDAAVLYPRRSFAELVAFGTRHLDGSDPDQEPSPEMAAIVRRFHRWAPWTPAPAKCLIRSFVLLRLLRRHGFDARWVFAVRTWPFEAHCWLQARDVALDDAAERLTAYHPILTV